METIGIPKRSNVLSWKNHREKFHRGWEQNWVKGVDTEMSLMCFEDTESSCPAAVKNSGGY